MPFDSLGLAFGPGGPPKTVVEAPDPWEGTATARGWWVVLFSKWLPESMNWVAACTKDNIELTSNPGLGWEKIWSGPYM